MKKRLQRRFRWWRWVSGRGTERSSSIRKLQHLMDTPKTRRWSLLIVLVLISECNYWLLWGRLGNFINAVLKFSFAHHEMCLDWTNFPILNFKFIHPGFWATFPKVKSNETKKVQITLLKVMVLYWPRWFHEEPSTSIEPFHSTLGSL